MDRICLIDFLIIAGHDLQLFLDMGKIYVCKSGQLRFELRFGLRFDNG